MKESIPFSEVFSKFSKIWMNDCFSILRVNPFFKYLIGLLVLTFSKKTKIQLNQIKNLNVKICRITFNYSINSLIGSLNQNVKII